MFDLTKFNYSKPKVIAEIGCNHKGELDVAKQLISVAKDCGAHYVKFQKRNNKELLTDEQYNAPHPNMHNSYGVTYGDHREYLEFSIEQHGILKKYCEALGLVYSTSVWDSSSAREVISLNPEFIKVPSACNNNFEMLKILRDEFTGGIQLSLGMTTKEEEKQIIDFFSVDDVAKNRLIIYACTSGYPVPFPDVALREITRLYASYGDKVHAIGFSGHHLGIAIDIAAYAIGAQWIERHFTLDRTWKGTDHAASLEPEGLRKMIRNLDATYEAMNYKQNEILDIETVQRDKLKYRK